MEKVYIHSNISHCLICLWDKTWCSCQISVVIRFSDMRLVFMEYQKRLNASCPLIKCWDFPFIFNITCQDSLTDLPTYYQLLPMIIVSFKEIIELKVAIELWEYLKHENNQIHPRSPIKCDPWRDELQIILSNNQLWICQVDRYMNYLWPKWKGLIGHFWAFVQTFFQAHISERALKARMCRFITNVQRLTQGHDCRGLPPHQPFQDVGPLIRLKIEVLLKLVAFFFF